MKWILVILIFGNGRPAVGTAEFNTKEACDSAAKVVKAEGNWGAYGREIYCVEKGEVKS